MRVVQIRFLHGFILLISLGTTAVTRPGYPTGSGAGKISVFDEQILYLEKANYPSLKRFLTDVLSESSSEIRVVSGIDGPFRVEDLGTSLTLREFLDRILCENGYSWTISPGGRVLRIETDRSTRTFRLTENQYGMLRRFMNRDGSGRKTAGEVLQKVIFGNESGKQPGTKYILQEKELRVTDSRINLRKVKAFLDRNKETTGSSAEGGSNDGFREVVNRRNAFSGRRYSQSGRGGVYRRIYRPRHRTSRDLTNALRGTVLDAN